MENIFLLGATGSIGMQTLDVIRTNSDKFVLISISVGHYIERAKKIIEEFKPEYVSVIEESDAVTLRSEFPEITIESGSESLIKCATYNPNLSGKVIVAVVGYAGIIPTLEAIKINRDILLANKETLVCAGSIVKRLVKEHNVNLIPIDSEHSAIFQALQAGKKEEVQRIIITASGGSFRDLSREELENVTLEDALRHPSWSMGDKITIDSATMVNKGLEVIEAHYLFDLDYDKIETMLHKESIIHSIVEYCDNSQIAQLAQSDMRIPIQYALTYPNRLTYKLSEKLNLSKIGTLHFAKMDYERFPMLRLAYTSGIKGGIMPTVYNVSNEVANELFRKKQISFLDIEKIITDCCSKFESDNVDDTDVTLDIILNTIKNVKEYIYTKYS